MKQVIFYLCVVLWICSSFVRERKGNPKTATLQIELELVFGKESLKLNTQAYINAHGDTLYIDGFRFYISGIKLRSHKNSAYAEKESYHLVDAEEAVSQKITLKNIPTGTYDELVFILGTDSLANVSGAMEGDLDPTKGMYWAWNTGYMNAKLEGHASVCKTLHHGFEFHIGGYLFPYQTAREVVLPLKETQVEAGKPAVLKLQADASEWFKNSALIDLAKTNSIVIPGKEAMMMADNYRDMFRVSN